MSQSLASQVALPYPAFAAAAPSPAGQLPPASAAQVRAVLQGLITTHSTPGLQYIALDESGVRFAAQAGLADVEQARAVTGDTSFHGYSVTKTFTAAAIVQLALAQKLDLAAPISTYLPQLADPRSPTLRQVLSHTAGYGNPIPLAWSHAVDDESFDAAAFFQRIAKAYGQVVREPGSRLAYSNVGYLLLGEVIARTSGIAYTDYVQQALITPLRLRADERLSFSLRDLPQHARGYIRRYSLLNAALGLFIDRRRALAGSHAGWQAFRDLYVDGAAYGGLLGNAAGFARYLQALLRSEAPFSPALTQLLFTPQTLRDGREVDMALGWFRGRLGAEPFFDHAGGGGGYYCELRIYPRLRRASVLLCNRTGIKNDRLLDVIDAALPPHNV